MKNNEESNFRAYFRKALRHLFLWTSQMNPQAFFNTIKSEAIFYWKNISFEKVEDGEAMNKYKLTFDFGDLQVEYVLTFNLSETTRRWVLSEII